MRYPLLRKELRESRLAILVGGAWLIGPLEFWFKYLHVEPPLPVRMLVTPAAMFAAGACMLMLGVARFAVERHTGTWEFLQTRPVSIRRAVAMKWIVPIGLAMSFISVSSGAAWYPMTHLAGHVAQMGLGSWVFMHAACAALFLSILLLIDTLDWGEWITLRGVVSLALVLPFMWLAQQDFTTKPLFPAIYLCTAAALCGGAIYSAPWLARESLLPVWRRSRSSKMSLHSPSGAWMWLQWRQVRFIIFFLLAPVPLFSAAIMLPGIMNAQTAAEQLESVRGMLPIMNRVMPGLLAISAGLLGWLIPLMEAQAKAESFRWSLPFARARMQQVRLLCALGLTTIVFLPTVAAAGARVILLHDIGWGAAAARLGVQLCMAAGVCCAMMVLSTFVVAVQVRFLSVVAGAAGIFVMVYVADQGLGARQTASLSVVLISALTVLGGAMLLQWTDASREI
jgi:hypothetical protein